MEIIENAESSTMRREKKLWSGASNWEHVVQENEAEIIH